MKYKAYEENENLIVESVDSFEPKHVFECGQCFRWNQEDDGSFTGVAYGKVLNVSKKDNNIVLKNTNLEDFKSIWYDYFDLERDYIDVKKRLRDDETLKKAIDFGDGIRILNQDEWEILISFIISANNRIPMIMRAINLLSEKYGEFAGEYKGVKYYSFPTPQSLSGLTVEDLADCKTGFRAKYIIAAADMVASGEIDIYSIKGMETELARKELMKFSGVGPKVSDCIMLFSMSKQDAFPIDVWVKRVMEYFYLEEDTKLPEIQSYANEKFGNLAGFAQQYLFYYARELGIGKKKMTLK